MRGRKRTPTNELKLRGTFRKDRHGERATEPELPPADDLTPPDWLSKSAAEEWGRVAPMLKERGVLTGADLPMLAAYCANYALFSEADQKYRELGAVIERDSGPAKSPWLMIRKDAHDALMKSAAELGITPTARSRVQAVTPAKESKIASRRRDIA